MLPYDSNPQGWGGEGGPGQGLQAKKLLPCCFNMTVLKKLNFDPISKGGGGGECLHEQLSIEAIFVPYTYGAM